MGSDLGQGQQSSAVYLFFDGQTLLQIHFVWFGVEGAALPSISSPIAVSSSVLICDGRLAAGSIGNGLTSGTFSGSATRSLSCLRSLYPGNEESIRMSS